MSLFRRSGVTGGGTDFPSSNNNNYHHQQVNEHDENDDHTHSQSQQHHQTRFQSLFQLQRLRHTTHPALRQCWMFVGVGILLVIYSVGLLGWIRESDQFLSYDSVIRVNENGIKLAQIQTQERKKRRRNSKQQNENKDEHDNSTIIIGINKTTNETHQSLQTIHTPNTTTTSLNATTIAGTAMLSQRKQQQVTSQNFFESVISFLTTMFIFTTVLTMVRAGLRICVLVTLGHLGRRSSGTTTTTRARRQVQFRTWADNLNRQRRLQGERPLSLESLRLVIGDRDLRDGDDYEGLLQFNEESGPAVDSLLRNIGATWEEINRCPQRKLKRGDDLLKKPPSNEDGTSRVVTGTPTASTTGTTDTSTSTMMPECAICLEPYQQGDWVRTIPCFHTFHRQCIDSWLANKAECPICKHTAIA